MEVFTFPTNCHLTHEKYSADQRGVYRVALVQNLLA